MTTSFVLNVSIPSIISRAIIERKNRLQKEPDAYFYVFLRLLSLSFGQSCLHLEVHGFQADGVLAEFEDGECRLDRDGVAFYETGLVER